MVATNGAGSPRSGIYGGYTDEEMQKVRLMEQRKAAYVGDYACQIQLGYTSAQVKNASETALVEDLEQILRAMQPEICVSAQSGGQARYAHRRAAALHRGFARRARIRCVRKRCTAAKCGAIWTGCRTTTNRCCRSSAKPNIAAALVGVFDSQISGGKRYDLATAGRRVANATYFASHGTDQETALSFAMDLTPLVEDPSLSVAEYVLGFIDSFRNDVERRLRSFN